MYVTLNLAWFIVAIVFIVLFFIISRMFKDKLDNTKDIYFKDKDVEVTSQAFNKIGEVKNGTPNEIILNLQNKENNKEIFDLEKRVEELEDIADFLQEENAVLTANYEVLKSRLDALSIIVGGNNGIN